MKDPTSKKLAAVKAKGQAAGEQLLAERLAALAPLEKEVRTRLEIGFENEAKADVILGKASNHYIATGLILQKIRAITGKGEAWKQSIDRCHLSQKTVATLIAISDGRTTLAAERIKTGLSIRWAGTLLSVADGKTTVDEVRGKTALGMARARENAKKETKEKTQAQLLAAAKKIVGQMNLSTWQMLVKHRESIHF